MTEIDITNSELLESLLEMDYGKSSHYDIHNDFDLKSISYKKEDNLLLFGFIEIGGKRILNLLFEDAEILEFYIPTNIKDLTLDNFHRGRYEKDNELYEAFNNKKCFYMEFYEQGSFNFLSSKALVRIDKKGKIINIR